MKQGTISLLLCTLLLVSSNVQSADDIAIKLPFAFQDRFQEGSRLLGFPEGRVLQLGCFIKTGDTPVQKVTAKNLDTGVVLNPLPLKVGNIWSGLYLVSPFPQFNPNKHTGEWQILVEGEDGSKSTARTHKLDDFGELPYVKEIKATGNPLSPLITWSAIDENDIPKNIFIKYQIRLLTDIKNQFHKSEEIIMTKYQIPEDLIKTEDLSKIYIRVDTLGYDITDSLHSQPFEVSSRSFIPLSEALRSNQQ